MVYYGAVNHDFAMKTMNEDFTKGSAILLLDKSTMYSVFLFSSS